LMVAHAAGVPAAEQVAVAVPAAAVFVRVAVGGATVFVAVLVLVLDGTTTEPVAHAWPSVSTTSSTHQPVAATEESEAMRKRNLKLACPM
jgi:hypothetical protein